jgi:hypothetical protein
MCHNIRKLLKYLSVVFGWIENDNFSVYVDEFLCRDYNEFNRIEELNSFCSILQMIINDL